MIRVALFMFIVYVALVISALADCLGGELPPKHLPRPLWALVILAVPLIGAILWFATGRPKPLFGGGAETPAPPPRTTRAPDDDPEFLRDLDRKLKGDGS